MSLSLHAIDSMIFIIFSSGSSSNPSSPISLASSFLSVSLASTDNLSVL
nr:MAG TPA: hypothetical protein [Caudoviricetes sp.]